MSAPDAETIAAIFSTAMKAYSDNSTRSKQTRIGASQVGFCRQKTAYLIKETPPSDTSSMWAATVGTAIHHLVADALHEMMPTWIVETAEVTATLPSGYEILGHPDILVPEWNLCLDLKSVDGFEWIKRNGSSRSHQYQRHLYALGAIQQGILDGDRPVYVGQHIRGPFRL